MNKKLTFVISALASLASVTAAHAHEPVCQTTAECQNLIVQAQARIEEQQSIIAQAQARIAELTPAPVLGPIARNWNGTVDTMTQREAVSYCATRGGLPTAKHLALALNPNGVSEVSRHGFDRVRLQGETTFYYNYGAYDRPGGDEGGYNFWSSSLPGDGDDAFVFNGYYGGLYGLDRNNYEGAVRCRNGH